MQCPQCGFENLPGIVVCTRCRAQLVADRPASSAAFMPPRAKWGKWLRPLWYRLTALGDRLPAAMPPRLSRLFVDAWSLSHEAIAALMFSAVPGLGHLLRGRRGQALAMVCLWLVLLCLIVIWFGHWFGTLCLGLTIGFHASAAMHAGQVRQIAVWRQRLACAAMVLTLSGCGYTALYLGLSRNYEVVAATFACEDLDVHEGDLLLADSSPAAEECFNHAWRVAASKPLARLRQAKIALRYEHFSLALSYLQEATLGLPKAALAWYLLGQTQEALAMAEQAQRSYQQAVALAPQNKRYSDARYRQPSLVARLIAWLRRILGR